ncbi:MAG TPA: exodeoxyribonuclease VII large subunit [Thermoleophilaceae bacterium]|nr:exodeoxyribonuclease VII large subunit [Thermoleophilaceae bacterium]
MSEPVAGTEAQGIPGYPGPFEVGRYAKELQRRLRGFTQVALLGEVVNFKAGRGANVYFELRDADGAVPCAMWRNDFDRLGDAGSDLRDGAQVIVAGGCDYYPGGASASPSFSFRVKTMRPAGEGDLLARLERLRRLLASEGLFERQKKLRRPALPRRIGVVTGEGSAARKDFLAGLERLGWRGQIVWGYAPVQDRRAAPAIGAALRDLAAYGEVDAIVVTRGGGSIADLWAFCDEALCRTVALLPVPVVSAVGHEVDRTLIDDVAAVSCSTPTHAAAAVVRVDVGAERAGMLAAAARLHTRGRGTVVEQARALIARSRAPREHLRRHRRDLHQASKELRATTRKAVGEERERQRRRAGTVLPRKREAALAAVGTERGALARRAARLDARARDGLAVRRKAAMRQAASLRALDPDRTLERGYALALGPDGELLDDAAAVTAAREFELRMSGGTVPARVRDSGT